MCLGTSISLISSPWEFDNEQTGPANVDNATLFHFPLVVTIGSVKQGLVPLSRADIAQKGANQISHKPNRKLHSRQPCHVSWLSTICRTVTCVLPMPVWSSHADIGDNCLATDRFPRPTNRLGMGCVRGVPIMPSGRQACLLQFKPVGVRWPLVGATGARQRGVISDARIFSS